MPGGKAAQEHEMNLQKGEKFRRKLANLSKPPGKAKMCRNVIENSLYAAKVFVLSAKQLFSRTYSHSLYTVDEEIY